MKRYEARRSGEHGTSIIVFPDGGDPYPLPFIDKEEYERRRGAQIVQASPGNRTHEWGYGGTGPSDTAASLLADVLGRPQPRPTCIACKNALVWPQPWEGFDLTEEAIWGWVLGYREHYGPATVDDGRLPPNVYPCWLCDGTGSDPEDGSTCPVCGGRGYERDPEAEEADA
jgi:hypothetical protein